MITREDAIRKVRALAALAAANSGAADGERANAKSLIDKLIKEHALTMKDFAKPARAEVATPPPQRAPQAQRWTVVVNFGTSNATTTTSYGY